MAKKKKSKQIKAKEKFIRTTQPLSVAEAGVKKEEKRPFKVKRIRMLMSVANEKDAFDARGVYKVGEDITPESAESYIRNGVAEEDTSLDVPEETKAIPEVEVPKEEEKIEAEPEIEEEKIVGVIDSEKDEEAPKEEEKEEAEKDKETKEEKDEIEKK